MIYYFTPYNSEGKLGEAYNDCCKIVPNDDDWICFQDFDTMLFPNNATDGIQQTIKDNPNVDLFTCWATRIGGRQQRYRGQISEDRDLVNLKKESERCYKVNYGKITKLNKFISGHFLLFKKKLWKEFPFPTKTKQGTILGIDNVWSHRLLKANKNVSRLDFILSIHFYRLDTNRKNKGHLKQ